MSTINSVQLFTLTSAEDLTTWKTTTFGSIDEYDRWSKLVYANIALFVEHFVVSKTMSKDGYILNAGYLACEPVTDDQTFVICRCEMFIPRTEDFDDSPVKRQFLHAVSDQFGLSFRNGEWHSIS